MSKEKYTGELSLKTILGFGKKEATSKQDKMKEFTADDIQNMWNDIKAETSGGTEPEQPASILPDWGGVQLLDSRILLGKYVGNDTDVTVQGSYEVDGEEYQTKLGSGDSQPSGMFQGNDTVESVVFEEGIDTSEMTDMSDMFRDCPQLKNVSFPDDFNTESVEDMSGMFKNTPVLEKVLVPATWNDEASSDDMFNESNSNKVEKRIPLEVAPLGAHWDWKYTLDGDYIKLEQYTKLHNAGNYPDVIVYPAYQISEKVYKTKISTGEGLFANITNSSGTYSQDNKVASIEFKPGIDYSEMTSMQNMFNTQSYLRTIIFPEDFDTSNVTSMGSAFNKVLAPIDLSKFNTSKVTNMAQMFRYYSGSSIDLSTLDTSQVTSMYNMFAGSSVSSIIFGDSFDTSKVTNMSGMFSECSNLASINLMSFDISSAKDMSVMFGGSPKLKYIYVSKDKWVIPAGCVTTNMFISSGCSSVLYR